MTIGFFLQPLLVQSEAWESVKHFFSMELLRFGTSDSKIVITVGLLFLVVASFFIAGLVLKLIRLFVTRKLPEDDQLKFLSLFSFIKYIIYILIVIGILSAAGVDITLLLTASAALFVGLGLALKEIFQDIIGGVYIILDKSLLVGDIIEMDGQVGQVFEIKLRTTRAITRDDKVVIIPNHKFISDTILNYTQNHKTTREQVAVPVAYGADIEVVKQVLETAAKTQKGVLKTPEPFVMFEDFGDHAMLFSIYFHISDSFIDPRIKSDIRFRIEKLFREKGITIPIPRRDIQIRQNLSEKPS